jgi:hypothetical protein
MNPYEESENISRDKTRALFPKYDLVESANIFSTWDFSGQTQHMGEAPKNFFIEVKNREVTSNQYDDNTSYLEADKLQRLTQIANQHGNAAIFYLNFYTDGVAYCYNLRDISITDVKVVIKSVYHKTKEATGKVDKLFYELPFKIGRKYIYNKS